MNEFRIVCWLTLALLKARALADEVTVLDQCSLKTPLGIISLQEIDGTASSPRFKMTSVEGGKATYFYNPCTPLKAGSNSNMLVYMKNGSNVVNLGDAKLLPDSLAQNFNYQGKSSDGKIRKTDVFLVCDETLKQSTAGNVIKLPGDVYTFTLTSKCACATKCKYDPNYFNKRHSGNAKRRGLSTGSIICILLAVFVIIYFVAGILVNTYVWKREGYERIPNQQFWKDVPALIKDGFVYSYGKLRGSSSERGQYQQIG